LRQAKSIPTARDAKRKRREKQKRVCDARIQLGVVEEEIPCAGEPMERRDQAIDGFTEHRETKKQVVRRARTVGGVSIAMDEHP
jgi:hypothetical protein